jgi:phosphatidylcholine synthase
VSEARRRDEPAPDPPRATAARRLAAWGVHLLTASSVPAGLLALRATVQGDAATAFLWMAYTVAIDSVDGTLARAVRVKTVIPWIDGSRLDDVVDYFTYVVVPAFFLLQMGLLPSAWAVPIVTLVVIASAYGFSQTAAKTTDHFFTGFPSYWNVVAFYLYALDWSPAVNAAWVIALASGVFVPLRWVYPSRTPTLRWLTVALGIAWGAVLIYALLNLATVPRPLVVGSLAFPVYYAALSVYLHVARRGCGERSRTVSFSHCVRGPGRSYGRPPGARARLRPSPASSAAPSPGAAACRAPGTHLDPPCGWSRSPRRSRPAGSCR